MGLIPCSISCSICIVILEEVIVYSALIVLPDFQPTLLGEGFFLTLKFRLRRAIAQGILSAGVSEGKAVSALVYMLNERSRLSCYVHKKSPKMPSLELSDDRHVGSQLLVNHESEDAHHGCPSVVELNATLAGLPLIRESVPRGDE